MSLDAYIVHQLHRLRSRVDRSRHTARPVTLPILVGFNGPAERLRDVKGFEVSSQWGNVIAGSATPEALEHLQQLPGITSIEASRPGAAYAASSFLDEVQAMAVYQAPWKEKGAEAVIGVIDSGFELVQKAFEDGAGHSRLFGVWDQTDTSGLRRQDFPTAPTTTGLPCRYS